jgi:DNA-binding NtrC family response regulator
MKFDHLDKNVLLVSDNAADVRHIERQFMDTGTMNCQLCQYNTIEEALGHVRNQSLRTDIVILDLRLKGAFLPLETYKRMVAGSGEIPLIVLTGESKGEAAVGDLVIKAGAVGQTHRGQFGQLTNLIKDLLFPGAST